MAMHVTMGMYCLHVPPLAKDRAGGVAVPNDATCMRATRHADYTVVDLSVGTPVQILPVLVRLDTALETDANVLPVPPAVPALRLFAQEVVESKSIECESTTAGATTVLGGRCTDLILASKGVNGDLNLRNVSFDYRRRVDEYDAGTVASRISSVRGELKLRIGTAYWITSTHLCYADATAEGPDGALALTLGSSDGRLTANRSELAAYAATKNAPAAHAEYTDHCTSDSATPHTQSVQLFPRWAAVEELWLSITDTSLYDSEPDSLTRRRTVVEVGTQCAAESAGLKRDLDLYTIDCATSCSAWPNVPFRRLAMYTLHLNLASGNSGGIAFTAERDPTLNELPRLGDSTAAFVLSVVKLAMITLAATVVYVRSKRHEAGSSWLVRHCVETADGHPPPLLDGSSAAVVEDGLIGLLAILARGLIWWARYNALNADGQSRVFVTEIVCTVLSLLHLCIRYWGLAHDRFEPPISKLGGSTAVVDATSAVMVSFCEPPLLKLATGRFDPTARLLIALIIALIAVTRCAFSASCCGVLWQTALPSWRYETLLLYTGAMWIAQSVALATLMCDLFVTPSTYSMMRSTPGPIVHARRLLFFVLLAAGLPRLNATARHILEKRPEKMHRD